MLLIRVLLDDGFFNPPAAPVKEVQPKEDEKVKEEKEKKEEKKVPITRNDMCCYLLKIVLGVVLILAITFLLHRWKKKMEK